MNHKIDDETTPEAKAWIIKQCPDFYFMPSQRYDRVFFKWEDDGRKNSPEYWASKGYSPLEIVPCEERSAEIWIINGGIGYVAFDEESALAARSLGKIAEPHTTKLS